MFVVNICNITKMFHFEKQILKIDLSSKSKNIVVKIKSEGKKEAKIQRVLNKIQILES